MWYNIWVLSFPEGCCSKHCLFSFVFDLCSISLLFLSLSILFRKKGIAFDFSQGTGQLLYIVPFFIFEGCIQITIQSKYYLSCSASTHSQWTTSGSKLGAINEVIVFFCPHGMSPAPSAQPPVCSSVSGSVVEILVHSQSIINPNVRAHLFPGLEGGSFIWFVYLIYVQLPLCIIIICSWHDIVFSRL